MSASFVSAANLRTRHTRQALLRTAWRRDPDRMRYAALRYVAHFREHSPDHYSRLMPNARRLYPSLRGPDREIAAVNHVIGLFGSAGYFDFVIYPVRGLVHLLNRLKRWIDFYTRRGRIRRKNYIDLVRDGNPTSHSAAGAA